MPVMSSSCTFWKAVVIPSNLSSPVRKTLSLSFSAGIGFLELFSILVSSCILLPLWLRLDSLFAHVIVECSLSSWLTCVHNALQRYLSCWRPVLCQSFRSPCFSFFAIRFSIRFGNVSFSVSRVIYVQSFFCAMFIVFVNF